MFGFYTKEEKEAIKKARYIKKLEEEQLKVAAQVEASRTRQRELVLELEGLNKGDD